MEEDLKFAVEDYCEAHNIPLQNTKKSIINLLANTGFILVDIYRDDANVNRIIKYPAIELNRKYGQPACSLDSFYRLNLQHPFLKKINNELCSRKKARLPIVNLTSDDKSVQELGYKNAEHRNHCTYFTLFRQYQLETIKKHFQNIFNYRFTKN